MLEGGAAPGVYAEALALDSRRLLAPNCVAPLARRAPSLLARQALTPAFNNVRVRGSTKVGLALRSELSSSGLSTEEWTQQLQWIQQQWTQH